MGYMRLAGCHLLCFGKLTKNVGDCDKEICCQEADYLFMSSVKATPATFYYEE